jgi:nitrogen regulatory protein PII
MASGLLAVAASALACSPTAPSRSSEPVVISVLPATGSTAGGTSLTISGSGFQPGATVTLSGAATTATVLNERLITAITPASSVARAVDVIVTNPGGKTGGLTGAYSYVAVSPPIVERIEEGVGSTAGGAPFRISGTGFQTHPTLTFGTVPVQVTLFQNSLFGLTPPHEAGTVDLVVTNADGQTGTLTGGYVFVQPGSLDFNGEWEGGAGSEGEVPLTFSIRGNRLIALACGGVAYGPPAHTVPVVSTAAVVDGQFSLTADDGTVTGRIVSPGQATGTLEVAVCPTGITYWYATKK